MTSLVNSASSRFQLCFYTSIASPNSLLLIYWQPVVHFPVYGFLLGHSYSYCTGLVRCCLDSGEQGNLGPAP